MGALAEQAEARAVGVAAAAPGAVSVMDGWCALALSLAFVVAVIVALPPEFDPAIRLREWLDERRK